MVVGVLALQGAVGPHIDRLNSLGVKSVQVLLPKDLTDLSGMILPGGESTAMIHLLKLNKLWEPLRTFASQRPTWGICAGAILLAKEVSHPQQDSLALMDISVERNAYGRQTESFIGPVQSEAAWGEATTFEGVFIRAPRIRATAGTVKTLFSRENEPVMVEQQNLLASTFHPELTENPSIHRYFIAKCNKGN